MDDCTLFCSASDHRTVWTAYSETENTGRFPAAHSRRADSTAGTCSRYRSHPIVLRHCSHSALCPKDRVITHDDGYPAGEEKRREQFTDDRRTPEADRAADEGAAGAAYARDEVKTYDREPLSRDRSYEEDDLESTRQYRAIDDETEREYRERQKDGAAGLSTYEDERSERGD